MGNSNLLEVGIIEIGMYNISCFYTVIKSFQVNDNKGQGWINQYCFLDILKIHYNGVAVYKRWGACIDYEYIGVIFFNIFFYGRDIDRISQENIGWVHF